MAGILSVVCTPIGNLEDVSLRTVRVLNEADVILAESITNAKKLLRLLNVEYKDKKILACGQHEEEARIKVVLERIAEGFRVALMSDAGAPSVSDPGGKIVEAVADAGLPIEVIPGPSALTAALMGAGLVAHRFAFFGFLPKKGKERKKLIIDARNAGLAIVIYEAPTRVKETLEDLHELCKDARVVVARELTKRFETFHRGRLGESLTPELVEKGEMVILIEALSPSSVAKIHDPLDEQEICAKVFALVDSGSISTKEGARQLAVELNISSRCAYDKIIKRVS